jgi:hypothetical protein
MKLEIKKAQKCLNNSKEKGNLKIFPDSYMIISKESGSISLIGNMKLSQKIMNCFLKNLFSYLKEILIQNL